MYLVIVVSEDGTSMAWLSEVELRQRLESAYYGERLTFLNALPSSNVDDWPANSVLIVRGEIVVPRPRTIVTTYDL